ncbi:MAG: hypothetical protein ACFBWO_02035 [Paracoccaceae bacterium]
MRPVEEHRLVGVATVVYAPTDWLALSAQGSVRRNRLSFTDAPPPGAGPPPPPPGVAPPPRRGAFETTSFGLGDMRLGASARLLAIGRHEAGAGLGLRLPTGDGAVREPIPAPGGGVESALLPRPGQLGNGRVTLEPGLYYRGWRPVAGIDRLAWGARVTGRRSLGESEAGFGDRRELSGQLFLAGGSPRLTLFASVLGVLRRGEPDEVGDEPLLPGQIRAPDLGALTVALGTNARLGFGSGPGRRVALALSLPAVAPDDDARFGLTELAGGVELFSTRIGGLRLGLDANGRTNLADRSGRDPFATWRAGLVLGLSSATTR